MKQAFSFARVRAAWDHVRGSFWFLPSLMATAAVVLSIVIVGVDSAMDDEVYGDIAFLYLFGPEGARAILAAVATSMITVAGLTFSITMLTLQLASSQFGPRMLRNFMRDRGNQIVLGTFISTFVYCLLVLRTVKGVEGAAFVPHLAVAVGVLLAVASLAVLIYFIHHTASSIRMETLLESLAAETSSTIDRLFPQKLGHGSPDEDDQNVPDFALGEPVKPDRSGYVQVVNNEALMRLAVEHDLVIRIAARPGAFVTESEALMEVCSTEPLTEETLGALRGTLVVGSERTPDQDLEFSIRRIVEIAQRSLSPGINDPTTALYCIDRLREAFVRLAGRSIPSSKRLDEEGKLRIVAVPATPESVAASAFRALAHYAGSDIDVLTSLATALDNVICKMRAGETGGLLALRRIIRGKLKGDPMGQDLVDHTTIN